MNAPETYRGKTPAQWVANHERMNDPPPCEGGHFGCSCSSDEGGPCLDRMMAARDQAEEREAIRSLRVGPRQLALMEKAATGWSPRIHLREDITRARSLQDKNLVVLSADPVPGQRHAVRVYITPEGRTYLNLMNERGA